MAEKILNVFALGRVVYWQRSLSRYSQIFSDIFLRESAYYIRILKVLVTGAKEPKLIKEAIGVNSSGRLSEYLWELELAGFITRGFTWSLKSTNDSKLSEYRISDNYIRFYLKYVEGNLVRVRRDQYVPKSLASLSDWYSVLGLQFENIVLNNREAFAMHASN